MVNPSAATDSLEVRLKGTKQPIPILKEALGQFRLELEGRFYAGEDAGLLIQDLARFIDSILQMAWDRFTWNENRNSWRKNRISLVAVGGYGRGELHPHSDIDLLVLLERSAYGTHKDNIQSFLTLLWDIGLEVGHSVRSVRECRVQARNDVTVLTALMESRTICGDDELRVAMQHQIRPAKIWPPERFFEAKRDEQNERHRKSDHTEYSLEPNVKTSPGGLRDTQTVMWIARRNFGTVNFDDLVALEFLTAAERDVLLQGQRLLWKIRFALHLTSKRNDDRLSFEHQPKLAELFGYRDESQLAVEQFMQVYYRTALEVHAVCELLLQHFEEAILRGRERGKVRPINDYFQVCNNFIEVTADDVFSRHPPALLEIFIHMGQDASIEGARAATVRLIRRNIELIDDDFRRNPLVTEHFLTVLRSSEHLFSQLRHMERYGILGAYLPEFGRVIGQMQFDLFHIYTVDAHTLQVVRNMRRFRYRNQEQRFPIAAHIYPRLPKVELLFIAGLYHDLAKGQGGDHSRLGEDVAAAFCKHHGLGTWDTNLVCWLVRNHLNMSYTAQRKDISDPDVIHDFALFVGDQVRLDYLYALTVADINATNPTLWNSWRATLMRQLYVETKKALRHGLENYVDKSEYITEAQNHAIERLAEHGISREEALGTWGSVNEDYFLRESVSDLVWHATAIKSHAIASGPLILIRDEFSSRGEGGATHIFIYGNKQESHFVATVTALDHLGINVVDARIASSDQHVFNTFIVLEANGQMVGERPTRHEQIRSTLVKHIQAEGRLKPVTRRRTPRVLKHFNFKTEVTIINDASHENTILEVVTPDRPGLLTIIANILVDMDIILQNAKITTLGERVEDVFYIVDRSLRPITYPDLCELLRTRICNELDHHVEVTVA